MTDFNFREVKEYSKDIECIKYLLKEVKNRNMDSNIYYEINYYYLKFSNWLKSGIEDKLIRLEIEDLHKALESVINSVSEDDARKYYKAHAYAKPLKDYDRLRYGSQEKEEDNSSNVNLNASLSYTRQLYTDDYYKLKSEFNMYLVNLYIFVPMILVGICFFLLTISCFFGSFLGWNNSSQTMSESLIFLFKLSCFIEFALTIILFFNYIFGIFPLKMDSLHSWNTGEYRLQGPECYKYYYTESDSDYYLYDRVWRNEIFSMNNPVYIESYNMIKSNEVSYKDKFKRLAGIEILYLDNRNKLTSMEDDVYDYFVDI